MKYRIFRRENRESVSVEDRRSADNDACPIENGVIDITD